MSVRLPGVHKSATRLCIPVSAQSAAGTGKERGRGMKDRTRAGYWWRRAATVTAVVLGITALVLTLLSRHGAHREVLIRHGQPVTCTITVSHGQEYANDCSR